MRAANPKTISSINSSTNVKQPSQKSKPNPLVSNGETMKTLPRPVNVKPKPSTIVKSDKPRSAPLTAGKKVKHMVYLINNF